MSTEDSGLQRGVCVLSPSLGPAFPPEDAALDVCASLPTPPSGLLGRTGEGHTRA